MPVTIDPELVANQIAHRYELSQIVLGQGGMGTVFQAFDKNLKRLVAIKFVKNMDLDETGRMRFQQEVDFLNRGEGHPNIVQVYDYGNVIVGEEPVPYLVMRYMPGGSLADRLYSLAVAHPDIRDQVLRDISEGLAFLHDNGIVHRDLKPANILFDSTPNQQWGRAHISDFGVSWLVSDTSGRIGSGGTGTDWYRAPEQKVGGSQPIDHRADIYAFGLIVWQLFTNRPLPFDLESLPPDTLSEPLQDALRKALAPDPSDRWSSVTEFFNEVMQSPHPLETPPYQGLDVITNQHTFFGRTSLVNDLVAFLDTHRDLALVGVSGSGKSSLVRAGLMPELWDRGIFSSTGTYLLTPTSQPLQSLADALTRSSELSKALATDFSGDPNGFHAWVLQNHEEEILIVVDQLEELFTECKSEDERLAFIHNLFHAVDHEDSRVRIVLTLRADFFSHCLKIDRLKTLLTTSQRLVDAMSPEELRVAIEGPANIKGWSLTFDEGLVDMMVQESSKDAGHLPLLSFALLQTWRRRKGRRLTLPDYDAIGRVEGAIAKTADDALARLNGEQREIARHILVRLVNLGEGTDDTRRRVYRSELLSLRLETEIVEEVLLALSKERLIIAEQDTVVLAHDAIIREWDQLKQWLAENREWKVTHRYLTNAANAWKDLDKDPGELFRGGRLTHTGEQAAIYSTDLNETEREFLVASEAVLAAEEAERKAIQEREAAQLRKIAEEESRRRRITVRALIGVSVLLIVAILVAIYATNQQQLAENTAAKLAEEVDVRRAAEALAETNAQLAATRASEAIAEGERANTEATAAIEARETAVFNENQANQERDRANQQARISRARELVAQAVSVQETNPQLSLLLAIESLNVRLETDEAPVSEAIQTLRQTLNQVGGLGLSGHESWISAISFSPDNKWFATASSLDGTTYLWNLTSPNPAQNPVILKGHEDAVLAIAFSADSQWIATGGGGDVVEDPQNLVASLFQANESFLTSLDQEYDNSIRLWNLQDPAIEPVILNGHDDRIRALEFSPDNRWLISTSLDHTVQIWDMSAIDNHTQVTPIILDNHESTVQALDVSPDSRWLVTGDETGLVLLWNLTESMADQDPVQLIGHEKGVWAVDFSQDGLWLVTGSADNTAKVWNLATIDPSENPITLLGHEAGIFSVAFSPDTHWLVTGSADGTARIWDWTAEDLGETFFVLPRIIRGNINSITFSPGSRWLITTAEITGGTPNQSDRLIRLWDLFTENPNEFPKTLKGFDDEIIDVEISTDGQWLGAGSIDGTARLWHITEEENASSISSLVANPITLPAHSKGILAVAVSPDNRWLATGSADNTTRLWDLRKIEITPLGNQNIPYITLSGHEKQIYTLDFSADSRWLATGSDDFTVRLWDLTKEDLETSPFVLSAHEGYINVVHFSADNHWLVSASSDNTARLWDLTQSDPSKNSIVLNGHEHAVVSAAFSRDNHWLVTGSNDSTARLWDLRSFEPSESSIVLEGHSGQVIAVDISADSRWLLTGSADGTARLWDLHSSPITSVELSGHRGFVLDVAISNDDHWLATGGADNTVRLWDLESADISSSSVILYGHRGWLWNVIFSPDSKILATGSLDGTVRLWDLTLANPAYAPEILSTDGKSIVSMAISPNARWLVTGGHDGDLSVNRVTSLGLPRLWPLQVDDLVSLACQVTGRNLSFDEWEQFFVTQEYHLTCENNPLHPSLLNAARELAKIGQIEGAIEMFEKVKELDPNLEIDPFVEANKFAAEGLVEDGISLARGIAATEEISSINDLQEAVDKFTQAIELDPTKDIVPENQVMLLAAEVLRSKASSIVQEGDVEAAILAIETAKAFDPDYEFSAQYWGEICWYGGIWDRASEVLPYCDLAIELEHETGNFYGSRGLVRTLLGDLDAALEDFEFAATWWAKKYPESQWNSTIEEWITALKSGENPINQATLESLR